jgi:hypothetical protein
MPHSLIIGGTGKLAGVAVGLGRQRHTVTVVARDSEGLLVLGERIHAVGGRFNAVHHDYRDTALLIDKLDAAAAVHGPYAHVISYINDLSAPQATGLIAQFLDALNHTCHYWDVLNWSAADPALNDDQRTFRARKFAEQLDHVIYHEVILGWTASDDGSRGLTDDQIAQGVLSAIAGGQRSSVVGTIDPFDQRPDG